MFKNLFAAVFRSYVSLAGALLTTVSAVLFLSLFAISELNQGFGGGYTGILTFLVLPALFVVGLVLIPVGLALLRRAERKGKSGAEKAPVIDLNVPRTRYVVAVVGVLSLVNVGIVATATYKGVETMESSEFCGGACHAVMSPEHTAYQRSPHSRVRCTQCHIGPGAEWFVRSKAQGSWQLVSIALDLYPRPIPTPVEHMRTTTETCEGCHARDRAMRDRLSVIARFSEDEANTAKKTVLLNKVAAVHWHVSNPVKFRSDRRRLYVSDIELPLADGGVRTYKNEAAAPTDGGVGPMNEALREMNCIDCHNRPTHIYQRPKDEVDRALARGELDRSLPWIRREALRVVQVDYPSWDAAQAGIKKDLLDFYAKDYPDLARSDSAKLEATAAALFQVYKRNVYPPMKITWGTYPNFRDHDQDNGCFRCHTSDMKSNDGKKISARCDFCHVTLAEDEENPEILEILSGE
jgi:hypothetical protein